jgi:hypothetical protein
MNKDNNELNSSLRPRHLLIAMAMAVPGFAWAEIPTVGQDADVLNTAALQPETLGEPVQHQSLSRLNDEQTTAQSSDASSVAEMFSKGSINGNFRTIYFSGHNAFFNKGLTQDTLSYGGKLGFKTAAYQGFSAGVSAYVQRGIAHSDDPAERDRDLGPNITAMGEAYLQWEHDQFKITAGNQEIDVPFASTYDWRMAMTRTTFQRCACIASSRILTTPSRKRPPTTPDLTLSQESATRKPMVSGASAAPAAWTSARYSSTPKRGSLTTTTMPG